MEKIKEIALAIGTIVCILLGVYLIISGIESDEVGLIIRGSLLCLVFLSCVFFMLKFSIDDLISNKREESMREHFLNKENKTNFDYFAIDALNEVAENKFMQYNPTMNKNNVYGLEIYYDFKDIVYLDYLYQGFIVDMIIKENEIIVSIDSPQKYDLVNGNEELEKNKIFKCDLCKMEVIDIYKFISNKVEECNDIIKEFIKDNKPNKQINGKTISKIEDYLSERKGLSIICIFFAVVMCFVGGMFLYYLIIDNEQFIAGAPIMCLVMGVIFVYVGLLALKYSVYTFYKIILFKRDKQDQTAVKIKGECVKVKLSIDGAHKSSDIYLKSMTLYIKNVDKVEKISLIVEKRFKLLQYKPKQIKNLVLNNTYELHYLKHSKYVLTGASKILSKIEK